MASPNPDDALDAMIENSVHHQYSLRDALPENVA
jgi:hypothetical protein